MTGILWKKKKHLVFFCDNQTVYVPAHAGTFGHAAITIAE